MTKWNTFSKERLCPCLEYLQLVNIALSNSIYPFYPGERGEVYETQEVNRLLVWES